MPKRIRSMTRLVVEMDQKKKEDIINDAQMENLSVAESVRRIWNILLKGAKEEQMTIRSFLKSKGI